MGVRVTGGFESCTPWMSHSGGPPGRVASPPQTSERSIAAYSRTRMGWNRPGDIRPRDASDPPDIGGPDARMWGRGTSRSLCVGSPFSAANLAQGGDLGTTPSSSRCGRSRQRSRTYLDFTVRTGRVLQTGVPRWVRSSGPARGCGRASLGAAREESRNRGRDDRASGVHPHLRLPDERV